MYVYYYDSPMGVMKLCADEEGLLGVWFDEERIAEASLDIESIENLHDNKHISDAVCWLDEYFAGNVPSFTPKLKLQGSEFRKTVSEIMLKIPYGELSTYGEIAREAMIRLGKDRMSAQAVGGAVGSNEFSIIVPCHRVVGKDGKLTGYAGGMDKKVYLLHHEGVDFKGHNLRI